MAGSGSILQLLDSQLEQLFAGWNIYTTLICLALVTYLIYPLFFTPEPDTHPFLLARQSQASSVRQPGESAIYRSLETPHGYPLRTGLNVKDPGAQKWTSGRDGDLRDLWKQALNGPTVQDGKSTGGPGKLLTILGREEVVQYGFDQLTKEINAVGEYVVAHRCARVAMYLPNSVELLVTFFAAAFYEFTPILIPQGQSLETLAKILQDANADMFVAAAGAIPLEGLLNHYSGLKQVIWVAERSSRHMEWNEIPEGVGGKADIAVWNEIIDEKGNATYSELPGSLGGEVTQNVITVWQTDSTQPDKYELVGFTQKNIIAATSGLLSAIPKPYRFSPSDLLLPLDSLSTLYPLILTLAALYSNASIALTSVSGLSANYEMAFAGVSPTIVIASEETMKRACSDKKGAVTGIMQKMNHSRYARSLAAGVMPKLSSSLPKPPPRIIFTSHPAGSSKPPLSSSQLSDLRILTGSRVTYALTAAKVAGAVSQLHILDYRTSPNPAEAAHFGAPMSCVEIMFKETPEHKIRDDANPAGRIIVSGPAVAGGEAEVGVVGRMGDDCAVNVL